MWGHPTCQLTPTREYQDTVFIHGSLGTGAFSNSPALYNRLTSPRTLSGPPLPVQRMPLTGPNPSGLRCVSLCLFPTYWSNEISLVVRL